MSQARTPGEWYALNSGIFTDIKKRKRLVAETYTPEGRKGEMEANAERIVLCCNAHDDLVTALRAMVADYAHLMQDDDGTPAWRTANVERAKAALAKAGEK